VPQLLVEFCGKLLPYFLEILHKELLRDWLAINLNPLPDSFEMWRSKETSFVAMSPKNRFCIRAYTALPLGSSNVNDVKVIDILTLMELG
jgi:hypothetical protein